ncbi:MAG: hypothetical protein LBG81_08760 [Coriobacteriaceae bacterium]|jgi:glucose-6-phosphate isomerase|nr:hypothetical protein [Coriobacteriaceae bacterium]
MLNGEAEKLYPSAKALVKEKVASRIHAKDASLYAFSEEAVSCAENYMGWTDLASKPPVPPVEIQAFADRVIGEGLRTVVLIGQGGSTQAPMTITKYNKLKSGRVAFRTLDSDSPVRVRAIVAEANPENTLIIVSSKSGGTIEPRLALQAVRQVLFEGMEKAEEAKHLVAITDPGSELERQAHDEGWLAVFPGEPSVGGRFSALSVFGLLPAALAGIDIEEFLQHALDAEKRCSEDAIDNPAISLAAFLYDNYLRGRDKFSFFTPKRGRVLGLWIEQLVAESLGKEGKGILPNIELDALLLAQDRGDRSAIVYQTQTDLWDERKNFEMSLAYIDASIPRINFKIDNVSELAEHFVMWEYAIAMCGHLMKVCPFDQPDVASAKEVVLDILKNGQPAPHFFEDYIGPIQTGELEVSVAAALGGKKMVGAAEAPGGAAEGSGAAEAPGVAETPGVEVPGGEASGVAKAPGVAETPGVEAPGAVEAPGRLTPCAKPDALRPNSLNGALAALFGSIKPGDYFALNAFLPFTGEGRREALENIRHGVGDKCRVASCLEVGPRYLHSTGQLQKGGPNTGVYLIVSADELKDIALDNEAESLGALAKAQASGDFKVLSDRGRRVVHIHLPDNSGVTLRALADLVLKVLEEGERQEPCDR